MYSFQYQDQEPVNCKTARLAVKYFDNKGWGFHNFVIRKNNVVITLEQFWNELDAE